MARQKILEAEITNYQLPKLKFMTSTISINDNQHLALEPLEVPNRLLLGPGPSNAHPTVLKAMSTRPLGHLDPAFLTMMDEIQSLLRYVWQTE